jgi:methionyl aminopeptidase
MVQIYTKAEIEKMRVAGRIAGTALHLAGRAVREGVTTLELDNIIRRYISKEGARASFYKYDGFPNSACISVNSKVIHGIPNKNEHIKNGDIVSIDVGAYIGGFHGDTAYTFVCGKTAPDVQKLVDETKEALRLGLLQCVVGNRIGDIGNAIQTHCESFGFGVVRDFIGHGVGRQLHESPEVPNFGKAGHGTRLIAGMTLAVEPMINLSGEGVRKLADGWTIVTKSGSASAHFEHTVAVTENGPDILTLPRLE